MELNTEIKKATDLIYQKVSKVIPPIEWAFHAPLIHKINMLKKQKNAVIFLRLRQNKFVKSWR